MNSKNYPDFMHDVWEFKKRHSTLKAVAMYSYAWLAGQVCRLGDKQPA